MSKQAPNTIGIHFQIDKALADAFLTAVPSNDRTNWIEQAIAKKLKRPAPEKRTRGRPKKAG